MMKNTVLRAAVATAMLSIAASATAASPFNYIGQQIVPTGTVQLSTTVGGLSGIDFNAATWRYFAISDDRSSVNPARFYDLSLDLNLFQRSNAPGNAGVGFNSVTSMLLPGGGSFPVNQVDPESIRFDGTNLYWTRGEPSGG